MVELTLNEAEEECMHIIVYASKESIYVLQFLWAFDVALK